jgi:V/A-type H+/Na+-transporting ATPase subunit E
MGLEVVLNQIVAAGQKEESDILEQAQFERDRILADARAKADEIRQKGHAHATARLEALRRELLSAAEFEARRRSLVAKRELAEDFHKRVLASLGKLPTQRNAALLDRLSKKAQQEIPKGTMHGRKAEIAGLAKTNYKPGRDLEGAGGFQIESTDGSVILDMRYETLLENVWKQILTENQALFEG